MGNNEEITKELDVIETNTEEDTEVVEKKSIGTKIGEFAGKVANSKVCRTAGKVIVVAGAVAGGFVLGKKLSGGSTEDTDDYYDAESEAESPSED